MLLFPIRCQRAVAPLVGLLLTVGCSAGTNDTGGGPSGGAGGSGPTVGGSDNTGGSGDGGTLNVGGGFANSGGAGGGDGGGPPINPCGTECLPPGSEDLCDGIHKGLDDDCDGEVDENCSCSAGQASSCFKGDPSFQDDPGCNDGTMSCNELGKWGPCIGGNHATEGCQSANAMGCHPINGVPFQTIDIAEGTGNFSDGADPATETYTVGCPVGVDPCPMVTGSNFSPLQSGEYTVTYTREVNGVEDTCTFPLYIGARGLRVELSWNFAEVDGGVDLDLHMKKPMSTAPWAIFGSEEDCGWTNCAANEFDPGWADDLPTWFPLNNNIPDPVNWYEDPILNQNTCYFAPRGKGALWEANGEGCHNPRLDLDNVSCTPGEADPQADDFCAPENINVDFPPKNEWIRIGVHLFSYFADLPVKPNIKIFCDGALAADLGTKGYYDPETPFSWGSSDDDKVWLVADVLFREDECVSECLVEPLYIAPAASRQPVIITSAQAESQNGPPYPAVP